MFTFIQTFFRVILSKFYSESFALVTTCLAYFRFLQILVIYLEFSLHLFTYPVYPLQELFFNLIIETCNRNLKFQEYSESTTLQTLTIIKFH
jgi:hypothetical protein